ncbi:phosphonate transport system ATP-binding protein [Rhodoligotrophos appendicifer]|uniref:phosphonate ABC transporter ATP-binding protein n=1 Tax=Rhodoligotrophos appendicifer TaxID=987056 RepID=UPI001180A8FE|nr:phosphonate ABC transporter ATP-binding protein [Rhodoligotrophos appendicifer]
MTAPAIEIARLSKTFLGGAKALKDVSFTIQPGEMVALIGASGSGKSTLLRHIAGLVPADRGSACEVKVHGKALQSNGAISSTAREIRSSIGMIFQQFNLVGRLSVLTNVLTGTLGRVPRWRGTMGWFTQAEKAIAMEALQRVGIAPQALQRGSLLSGGQQQRAAIARTLVQGARVLIADEPIASLDPHAARRVMDILNELNSKDGITVVVSLHQVEYAIRYCPRTIALRHGELVYDGPSTALTREFLGELYGAESEELFLPSMPVASPEKVTVPRRLPVLQPA